MAPGKKGKKKGDWVVGWSYHTRIRFGETDPFGIIYFASLFKYLKDALDEFIRLKGLDPILFYRNKDENFAFPIVSACANYLFPIRYDEEIDIRVEFKNMKRRSFTFSFIVQKDNGVHVADGELTLACIDKNWKSREIPESIRNALSGKKEGN